METVTDSNETRLLSTIEQLESRLKKLESSLDIPASQEDDDDITETLEREAVGFEYRLGRVLLPRVGVVVFTLGVVFLLTMPLSVIPNAVAPVIGFVLAAVVLGIARIWGKSIPQFARTLDGAGMLLLFFSTLRLHFFSPEPLIASNTVVLVLLAVVTGVNMYLSVRADSPYLTALSVTMGYAASLASSGAYGVFACMLVMTVVTATIAWRKGWAGLLPTGLASLVFAHFHWALGNPLFGNAAAVQTEPYANLLFFILSVAIYGAATIQISRTRGETDVIILSSFFAASMPYVLVLFLSLFGFKDQFTVTNVLAAVMYLMLAVASWQMVTSRYPTFFYTMIGNLALSAAIFSQFTSPTQFLALCLQSFLVISMAVWFRSPTIAVTNILVFLTTFIAYLVLAPSIDGICLVFGFVALASARIMNWQKERLGLKSDFARNTYLFAGQFIFPFALYHMVAPSYVSLSWIGVAGFFYLMGRLLKNHKYRWMAMTTLLLAVVHLIFVGTTQFEPTYRIISFIVLGIVLLLVSLWYFKTSGRVSAQAGSGTEPPAAVH